MAQLTLHSAVQLNETVPCTTSVASFWVLGGQDPQMYRQKKVTYYARASASET